MLHIHFSNRLEPLRDLLLRRLAVDAPGVFDTETVIVPNAALQRHLSLAVADAQGICANLRFAFLAEWLWQQIARLVPGVAPASPFAATRLGWRVHNALCDAAFVSRHPRLAAYLRDADALMRWELAQRIGGLLEQYVTYRPDWLRAWSEGRPADVGTPKHLDEGWQAALWQRIAAELGVQGPHPAQAFVAALAKGGEVLARRAGLPARVHVFALPGMPDLHMRLLQHLGACIEVHVYVLNPCREYWFELVDRRRLSHLAARGQAQGHEEGNRLLATWGKQTQAHVDALLEGSAGQAEDDAFFEPAPGQGLLAQLQNAILDLQALAPGTVTPPRGDRSVEVHVCHSLTRELEVLQDHLLGLFVEQPGLRPGDILIVTPLLDDAAPLIDAIFGTVPRDRFIPYAIAGRSRSGVDAPQRALLALLSLVASRVSASALFALLQQPPVARRFGLDDEALAQVHEWLRDAGLHWALDAQHRASFGVPAQARHTLADALQRLFLGYALPQQAHEPFAELLGAGNAEGSNALALGAFWRFAHGVQRLHARVCVPMAPEAWAGALFDMLDEFLLAQDDELEALRDLRQSIRRLCDDMLGGGVFAPLPLAVLRAALQQQLEDPARGGAAGGGLNFASMGALRGLPFKVVCAIGLNDGAFPTAQRPLEFDLIALHPRRGDRQRARDERGLMLDLLLSARSSLYLSYTGRSVRDNSSLPPSVLVADLLDILVPAIASDPASPSSLAMARQQLVVEHALQPFAQQAFEPGGDVRQLSFNTELGDALRHSLKTQAQHLLSWQDGADVDDSIDADRDEDAPPAAAQLPFFRAPLPLPEGAWQQVTLAQLVEFFRNPCRYLLRRRLRIELPRQIDELQDDEPFLGDGRARSALASRLLPAFRRGATMQEIERLARAGTEMPDGAIGERQLQRELAALQRFSEQLRMAGADASLPPQSARIDFELEGEGWQLHATFAELQPCGLLRWRYGPSRAGDYLEAWLAHLALCAAAPAGVAPRTRWLSADGEFAFAACADAPAQLRELMTLYRRGLCAPLRFFPRTAWMYTLHGRSKAWSTWQASQEGGFSESDDPAYRLALRGIENPLDAQFEALARAVFTPLLAQLDDARVRP